MSPFFFEQYWVPTLICPEARLNASVAIGARQRWKDRGEVTLPGEQVTERT